MNEAPARRPGGLVRLLGLLATAAGFFAIFSIGFPPASRDRLPVLALAGGLALVAAWDRGRGLCLFAFLFPLVGLGDRLAGGADAIAWPVLLFLGLAAGWSFRFLYDFESAPDPSRADRFLGALLALWGMAAALGVVRARTLWALLRGLRLRAVNVNGLPDTAAIRIGVLSFAALAVGAAFFFLLRRAGRADRERALLFALGGTAASAAVAVAERLGLIATETSSFWRRTGRVSGGALDPNALGILCACAAVVAAALAASATGRRRVAAALALPVLAAGLALSGSRSGLALAALGLTGLLLARALSPRLRLAVVVVAAALVLGLAASRFGGSHGSAGARVLEIFDPRIPIEFRVSTRTVLWRSAARLFEHHPLEGAGLGAFTWQLPNVLAEEGRSLKMSDNPGSAYLQALAETGVLGFALTLAFVLVVAREAWAALRDPSGSALRAGAGAATLGFLAALVSGSHWFAPDAALFFFLLTAVAAPTASPGGAAWPARVRGLALGAYAAAALWSMLATLDAREAFRYRREIGFHAEEVGAGGLFRWTQRRFAIRLEPGDDARMALAHFTPEGRNVVLTADADGRTVLSRTLEPGQAVALRLSAGPAARVFRFTLSRSFVPRRLGTSSDGRELGVTAVFGAGR
ncbi:MAG TPA: O-antigen ligase family protein [Thermoanaerobaculia bacterium]|nr:O-antigen ligase family protein [Thermoanaerobaculia bacterium]